MRIADLEARLESAGAHPLQRSKLLGAWLHGRPLAEAEPRTQRFGRRLWEALGPLQEELEAAAVVLTEQASADGSTRLLLRLRDGASLESVLLPRDGLCISTQVGCAVGCVFCKTGEAGLLRQVSDLEMGAQVALARRRRPVRRVVLMGMGEPAHNLEAVLSAIDALGGAGGLPHKGLMVSSVGDRRLFEGLHANRVRPGLALSLHTTDADLRARLLPRAPRIGPEELLALALAYCRAAGTPLQVQWTLLAGINDGDGEIERLAELLRGERAIVNFIPWNQVDGQEWARPATERAVELVRGLKRRGVMASLRRSAGADVDGACGQLRSRTPAAAALALRS